MPIQKVANVIIETPTLDDDQFLKTGTVRSDGFAICDKVDRVKQLKIDPSGLLSNNTLTLAAASGGSTATIILPASGTIANASFKTIQTDSGTSPVAASPTDTITLTSSDASFDVNGNSSTDVIDLKTKASQAIAALSIDWKTANVFSKSISGNSIFTFANTVDGKAIVVAITTTGSFTATWPTVKWPAGAAPTQTASGTDVYTFVKIGSTIYGSVVQAMA